MGNECLTTDSRATWYEYFARWRVFKYIKKKPSKEENIGRGIDIVFRVRGIILASVDKAASSGHMDAANPINLDNNKKERALEGAEQIRPSA